MITYTAKNEQELRRYYRTYIYGSVRVVNTILGLNYPFDFNEHLINTVKSWEHFRDSKVNVIVIDYGNKIRIKYEPNTH
jgi:hypothetical protein